MFWFLLLDLASFYADDFDLETLSYCWFCLNNPTLSVNFSFLPVCRQVFLRSLSPGYAAVPYQSRAFDAWYTDTWTAVCKYVPVCELTARSTDTGTDTTFSLGLLISSPSVLLSLRLALLFGEPGLVQGTANESSCWCNQLLTAAQRAGLLLVNWHTENKANCLWKWVKVAKMW